MLIIITHIWHGLPGAILPHLLIKLSPVRAALFAVYLMVKIIQLRMVFMDPLQNACSVVTAKVQVLRPDEVALFLCLFDDFNRVCNSRKIGKMKHVVCTPAL